MDETKQNDKAYRGETGSVRIPRPDEREIGDILCAAGHAYQMVHAQEPSWVLYLRLTTIDGNDSGLLRILLRSKGPAGGGVWTGDAWFLHATEG